jgi:hypothetical protein
MYSLRLRLSDTNEKLDNKTKNKIRQIEILAIRHIHKNKFELKLKFLEIFT